jgi:hypothetical protein
MKRIFGIVALSIIIHLNSCEVLDQLHEYERFIQCSFTLQNIRVLEISGIDISSLDKRSDLGFTEMMTITQALLSGSFPAKISVDLKATNNNSEKAGIAGMDWKILMKEEEMLSGMVDRAVEILPQSSTDFPVKMEVDLISLLQSESLPKIMAFVFGEKKREDLREIGVGIKIKPYYKSGSEIKKYPGYISINP